MQNKTGPACRFFQNTYNHATAAQAVIVNPPALIAAVRDRVNARQKAAEINSQHSI